MRFKRPVVIVVLQKVSASHKVRMDFTRCKKARQSHKKSVLVKKARLETFFDNILVQYQKSSVKNKGSRLCSSLVLCHFRESQQKPNTVSQEASLAPVVILRRVMLGTFIFQRIASQTVTRLVCVLEYIV